MATNGIASSIGSDIIDPDIKSRLQEAPFPDSKSDNELQNASELSYEVEMALAYSSEKLANLENLLLCVLSEENDIGSIDVSNDDNISSEFFEKAFTVDLLYSISHLELREVDKSMSDLQDLISNAVRELSTSDNSTTLHDGLLSKLRDSEEMLKNSQESVLEMKIQLAKLQMNSIILRQDEWMHDMVMDVKEEFLSENTEWKPEIETFEHRRVLSMLEKSLARELELEKKLLESKQNEEDLKSKNHLLEQVSVSMEEAAQVAWSRFLEADNTSAVLMGISKDMLEKFRVSPSNLRSSSMKEEEISLQLKDCLNQLNANESLIQKLNSTISLLTIDNAEVPRLREKVQKLENNLGISESRLKESYSSNEIFERQIKEMSREIESLRENLHDAEIRAESAEEKVSHLTDSNMELTEEIDFLKDANSKNVSLLEKQLRELDVQFIQAKASSDASLGQQHMLYSAIWDMETLIDELKQKVAEAESNNESAEERNTMLSRKNEELEKEVGFLRAKVDITEEALNQVELEREASAKDICLKTSLIMDTVMQIGLERQHLQKTVNSLMKENTSLRKKLHIVTKDSSEIIEDDTINEKNDKLSSVFDSDIIEPAEKPEANPNKTLPENLQVESSTAIKSITDDNRAESSCSTELSTDSTVTPEKKETVKTRNYQKVCLSMALFVALLSILASKYLFQIKHPFVKPIED